MIHNILKEEIRVPGTLSDTYLETFMLEVTPKFMIKERPLIVVCPGGGYRFTSDREAEIVAMQFNAMGYHTAVLRYSCAPAEFPTALMELSKAVARICGAMRTSGSSIRSGSPCWDSLQAGIWRLPSACSGTRNGMRRSAGRMGLN